VKGDSVGRTHQEVIDVVMAIAACLVLIDIREGARIEGSKSFRMKEIWEIDREHKDPGGKVDWSDRSDIGSRYHNAVPVKIILLDQAISKGVTLPTETLPDHR
jgi:hypothetical protein